ncbi:hypothetical protein HPB50_024870 [Hyalomma asiaticum]|uniref:Uncharacterized protein n=1 Tax=Hyalomma asiaticum TaxID=266040 RepID=A0ACB7RJV4_HYAAI|nr:hypothetical protein HPB50_024870 [Hyalomma asiaticum]
MTATDMTTLFAKLEKASHTQILSLQSLPLLCLPWSDKYTKHELIVELVFSLRRINDRKERISRMASLYCRLSTKNILFPWHVYRVNPCKAQLSYFALHRNIARALCVRGSPFKFVTFHSSSARYACIMLPDFTPATQHEVVCVCVWRRLNYVAVWAAQLMDPECLPSALAKVFGRNLGEISIGSFRYMPDAYKAARRDRRMRSVAP